MKNMEIGADLVVSLIKTMNVFLLFVFEFDVFCGSVRFPVRQIYDGYKSHESYLHI